jgi:hypothetical protein
MKTEKPGSFGKENRKKEGKIGGIAKI